MRVFSFSVLLTLWVSASPAGANQALDFDGTSDYVTLPIGQELGLDKIKTIEAWVKPHFDGYTPMTIYGAGTNMFFCQEGRIKFQTDSSNGWKTVSSYANAVPADQWNHVAVVFEGSGTDQTKLYVNGVLENTGTIPNLTMSSTLRLGRRSTDNKFNGLMDEVRLWGVARSASEIAAFKDASMANYSVDGLNAVYNMENIHSTNKLDNATGVAARDGTLFSMSTSNQTNADDYWGTNWRNYAEVTASDAAANDLFGMAVAMDGDTVVVGAPYENSNAGAVYVYVRDASGDGFTEQAKLTRTTNTANHYFGMNLDISGNRLVVGAYYDGTSQSGAVYHFIRNGSTWDGPYSISEPTISAGDNFGSAVALDGTTLVVGASGGNKAYVYEWGSLGCGSLCGINGEGWKHEATLQEGTGTAFQGGIDVSVDGDLIAVADENWSSSCGAYCYAQGRVHMYYRNGSGDWNLDATLTRTGGSSWESFGRSVSLSNNRVAIGVPAFHFGAIPDTGAVYVYTRDSDSFAAASTWTGVQVLSNTIGNGDYFGASVSMDEGRLFVVSLESMSTGELFVLREDGTWAFEETIGEGISTGINANHEWEAAGAIEGETLVYGQPKDNSNRGKVFLFEPHKAPTHVLFDSTTSNTTTVTEGVPGATVATMVPVDYSRNDPVTLSITADDSANGIFELVGSTLKVKDDQEADYEETAQYNITIQVADGAGLTVSRDFRINVDSSNEAPEPVAGLNTALAVDQGESVSASVSAVDPEGSTVTYALDSANAPANGSLTWTDLANGSFTYTHDDSQNLTDTFVLLASDPESNTTSITYTVTVTGNQAPVLTVPVHEWYACSENGDCSASSYGCCDCDYNAVASAHLTDYQSYYPEPSCDNFNGACPAAACLGVGCSDNGVCTQGLGGGTVSSYISYMTDEDTVYSGTFSANDAENDPLSYSVATGGGATEATKGTVTISDASTGAFTYTPNAHVYGTDTFTVNVSDNNQSSSAEFKITIRPVDDLPIPADKSVTGSEGDALTITLTATDADNTDASTVSFSVVTQSDHTTSDVTVGSTTYDAASGVFSADASYTHDGTENLTDSFTYQVTSAGAASATNATVSVSLANVNDAPTGGVPTITPSSPSTTDDLAATANDLSDVDVGDAVTGIFDWRKNGASIAVLNMPFDTQVTSTAANALKDYSSHGNHGTLGGGEALKVPTWVNNGIKGGAFSFDGNGDYIDIQSDLGNHSARTISLWFNTPATNSGGQYLFEGRSAAESGDGSYGNGWLLQDYVPSTCVPEAGEPPFSTDTCPCNDTEGNICFFHKVQIVSSDISANTWHHVAVTVDASASKIYLDGVLKDEGAGFTLVTQNSVRLGQRYNGTASFEGMMDEVLIYDRVLSPEQVQSLYNSGTPNNADLMAEETVRDEEWTVVVTPTDSLADGAAATSAIATVTNTAPTITGATFTVAEETLYSDAITVFDADGDALTYGVQTAAGNGTVTVTENEFFYTSDVDYTGSDTFSLWVSDNGGTNKSIGSYDVTVTNVNDAPVATADSYTYDEGSSNSETTGVLSNDTDVEDDALTAVLVSDVSNGTLVLSDDGTFTYTHDGSETSSDSFTYKPNDGSVDGNTVTVSISITGENDAPVATADSYTYDEGSTNSETTSVLNNDTDAESDALTAVLVDDVSNGTLTLNDNGTFTYTHDGSETSSDSFAYKPNDGSVDGNTVTVSISITAVNDAPVAMDAAGTGSEGGTATAVLSATDVDSSDPSLFQFEIVTSPAYMTGEIAVGAVQYANGEFTATVTYTHDGSETTSDSFTYRAKDSESGPSSNEATVTVTIDPVNNPPVAQDIVIPDSWDGNSSCNDPQADCVAEGALVTVTLTATDAEPFSEDACGTGPVFEIVQAPEGLTPADVTVYDYDCSGTTMTATAIYQTEVELAGGESGTDAFTYQAYDAADTDPAYSNEATVTVHIGGVNDFPVISGGSINVTIHEDNGTQNPSDVPPVAFALTVTATDPDTANLTWSILGAPSNGTASIPNEAGAGDATATGNSVVVEYAPSSNFPYTAESGTDAFTIQVTDGQHTVSEQVNVTVQQINDAPTVAYGMQDKLVTAGNDFSARVIQRPHRPYSNYPVFQDPEDGLSLSFSAHLENGDADPYTGAPLPFGTTFNPGTRRFFGTPTNADVGSYVIRVVAEDTGGLKAYTDFTVRVIEFNDPPVVINPIDDRSGTQGVVFELSLSGDDLPVFSDDEDQDGTPNTLSISCPAWLSCSFSEMELTLAGTPQNSDVGDNTVTLTATDPHPQWQTLNNPENHQAQATHSFNITIANVNDAPFVRGQGLRDRCVMRGGPGFEEEIKYGHSTGAFGDVDFAVDPDEVLNFTKTTGSVWPNWLDLNVATPSIVSAGAPMDADLSSHTVSVTATDRGGLSVSDSFELTVIEYNEFAETQEPATPIPDQSATEDALFEYTIPNTTFANAQNQAWLSYSAVRVNDDGSTSPMSHTWLSFDAAQQKFSGTPTNAHVGVWAIRVTASDCSGSEIVDQFAIDVANVNDPPIVGGGGGSGSGSGSGGPPVLADQYAEALEAYTYDVSNVFSDPDAGDTLALSASADETSSWPTWLLFDQETKTFSSDGLVPEEDLHNTYLLVVTAEDAAGETASASFTLTVIVHNDPPFVLNPLADQTALEDETFVLTLPADGDPLAVFGDSDLDTQPLEELTYQAFAYFSGYPQGYRVLSSHPGWLSFDSETRTFTGTPDNSHATKSYTLKIVATDFRNESAETTFSLTVENTNDSPEVGGALPDLYTIEYDDFSYSLPSNTFSDPDPGENFSTLEITAQLFNGDPLPWWLRFENNGFQITGTDMQGENTVGVWPIRVTAKDVEDVEVFTFITLFVTSDNDAPELVNPIPDRDVDQDNTITFTFANDTFAPYNPDQDVLVYNAALSDGSALPDWLSFDASTRTFTGTPGAADVDIWNIKVRADDAGADGDLSTTDDNGGFAEDYFSLTVNNINDAPVTVGSVDAQTVLEDVSPEYQLTFLAEELFFDIDGDPLTLSIALPDGGAAPSWLSFANGTLWGTPRNNDVGAFTLRLTASDGEYETYLDVDFVVENTNDAPIVSPIADLTMKTGDSFSLPVGFTDVDVGDTHQIEAYVLGDAGLGNLTLETGADGNGAPVLNVTAIDGYLGEVTVQVVVTDDGVPNLQGATTFVVTVEPVPTYDAGDVGNQDSGMGDPTGSDDAGSNAGPGAEDAGVGSGDGTQDAGGLPIPNPNVDAGGSATNEGSDAGAGSPSDELADGGLETDGDEDGGRPTYVDCAGQELGSAYVDSCGQCVGGLTGATPCEATEDGGAGSSDAGSGSGEEVDVTDGGTPDSDPSGDQDAGGASTGETDAGNPDDPMLPDAGSEPATDAGAEWGAMDGGFFEGPICDDYECDPGFECVVEWLDCAVERFDAGSSDGGSQCIDYEVVCIEVGDAGSPVPTAVDSGPGLPEVIDAGVSEARDGGHTATGSPEDGGDSSVGGVGLPPGSEDPTAPSPDGCNCEESRTKPVGALWLLVLFFGRYRVQRGKRKR